MCVALEEDNGFVGPFWSRYVDAAYKEEVQCVLKDALIAVFTGAMESAGLKVKRMGVSVGVLRDRQRFVEVGWSVIDKVDEVECRFRLSL